MFLSRLTLENFRNYQHCSIEFDPQGALFFGLNGSGKTNILEAMYFLCAARSQRQASREEMISFSSEFSFVEGVFKNSGDGQGFATASAGFSRDKKITLSIDGLTIPSFSQWFGRATAIAFGPGDICLIQGNPKERRTFLDMLLCQIDQEYLKNLVSYKKNCAQRNVLLATSGDETAMDIYEQNMASSAAVIALKRKEIISFMQPHFTRFYMEISGNSETASIEYKPSFQCDLSTQNEWENVFYTTLKNARKKDIRIGFTSVGPHRDELSVFISARPAKQFASQGQCTTLTLSLKMCSILCCEAHKKETMLFLFDDALTYLDEGRTSRVFPLVRNKGQLFFATASERPALLADIPHYIVGEGQVRRA